VHPGFDDDFCTEISFMIDTSQATAGQQYRLILATKDNWRSDKGVWRGPVSVTNYATLTIESSTTQRYAKDNQPKFANCTDTDWGCLTVHDTGAGGVFYTSIAFDPAGNAWVSYEDNDNNSLTVAQYVGSGGSGCDSGAWSCTIVHDTGSVGTAYTSIAFDPAGNAWVSYLNADADELTVAQYVGSGGSNCTSSAWTCTIVHNTGGSNGAAYTSLAFDPSGNAWVSYENEDAGELTVAQYVGSGGTGCTSGAWTCTIVHDTGISGVAYTSIAFDPSGNAWVSYENQQDNELTVAQYVGSGGANCTSSAWTCTIVHDTGGLGAAYISLAFDPSGNAWVSYENVDAGELTVAQYVGSGGSNCTSSAWSCTIVHDPGTLGVTYTSIAFDPSGNAYWSSPYSFIASPVIFCSKY